MRNTRHFGVINDMSPCDPTTKTIIKEKIKTIIVLNAVAKFEPIFFIPFFARTDVAPANTAERTANNMYKITTSLSYIILQIMIADKSR